MNSATYFLAALILLLNQIAVASDHIDGPVTTAHAVGDLTDLYAFPAPEDASKIVIVLNVYPMVGPTGHFSEKVDYRIALAETTIGASKFNLGRRTSITCRFITPEDDDQHSVTCKAENGLRASVRTERVSDDASNSFLLFAGHRSDPFFFNADWAQAASTKGLLLSPANSNVMDQINCLSIVMVLDVRKLGIATPMLSMAAVSIAREDGRVLDRVGRPEITNVSMVARSRRDLRDGYNQENPFQIPEANLRTYKMRLQENMRAYDKLDGVNDLSPQDLAAWPEVLTQDFLVIDLTKPSRNGDFLEIEKSVLVGAPHRSFGGRRIEDDIMDDLFTLYINGGKGGRISDGVDKPYQAPSRKFPYLADPDMSWSARTKAWIARNILVHFF